MKIAVASTDGQKVDCHFGKADRFFVYQIESDMVISEGAREVEPYCATGSQAHLADEGRIRPLIEALEDCATVYVARIGETPRRKLEEAGLCVRESQSFVHELLSLNTGDQP